MSVTPLAKPAHLPNVGPSNVPAAIETTCPFSLPYEISSGGRGTETVRSGVTG